MDLLIILAIVLLGLCFLLKSNRNNPKSNSPPGPVPLPVIGNLHLLGDKPHQSLANLARKYGPVMTLKLGTINTVVISSSAITREALQKQDLAFSTRFTPDAIRANDHHKLSSVWIAVSPRWRSLRRIMNSAIFSGSKLDSNQELRGKKVQELIAYCRKQSETGEAVDIGSAAFRTMLNLLSNMIFSRDLTDPFSDSSQEFKQLVWNIMVEAGKPNMVDYFPFLAMFDPQRIRRRLTDHFTKVLDLFDDLIDERIEERKVKGSENVDVIDSLLSINEDRPEEIDRAHINHMFLDLFAAGTDTSSNTLEWAMAELFNQPEIMRKAQAELAEVVGKGKAIDENDITRLPYLQCIVKETFRRHPPVPFLIPRTVERDELLSGYIIPKDSQVLVNVWAIGRDPNVWKDPEVFKPERFWNSELDVKGQDFELIPFGAGRRICPGLPVAVRMIPVMLGSLLNSFEWKLEGDIASKDLDMEEKFGITLAKAQPLKAIPIPP